MLLSVWLRTSPTFEIFKVRFFVFAISFVADFSPQGLVSKFNFIDPSLCIGTRLSLLATLCRYPASQSIIASSSTDYYYMRGPICDMEYHLIGLFWSIETFFNLPSWRRTTYASMNSLMRLLIIFLIIAELYHLVSMCAPFHYLTDDWELVSTLVVSVFQSKRFVPWEQKW